MFKVNYMNGDRIDTASGASGILGKALHKAMQTYLGGNPDVATPADESEAILLGQEIGWKYLKDQPEGFIAYNKSSIKNRTEMEERYLFSYQNYIKESSFRVYAKETLLVEKKLLHKVEVDGKVLPIPLKGYPDFVYRDDKGRVCIEDHKFTSKYSDEESIDGEKLIQAIFLFFLVGAETGEVPYKMKFREFKITPNQDKSPQTREFEIIYSETPLAFDFFYRLYDDITNALLGKQSFIPNIKAMYDKEVAILAYIHRLDIDEERAKAFKEAKVDNITDFLKMKVASDRNTKKYLEAVASKFISAKTMNYKDKTIEERIRMKLMEHGIGMEFDSKEVGGSVTLYKYECSVGVKMSKIEAYAKDIEQVTGVSDIRILAPIPHSDLIGFEVPNKERVFEKLPIFVEGDFNIAMGKNIMGETRFFDIREAPHLLIAGATGGGKSYLLSSIIKQLSRVAVEDTEIRLYDPKIVELGLHKKDNHVVEYQSDPIAIQKSLMNMVGEMNARYKLLAEKGVRDLKDYKTINPKYQIDIPFTFLVIDEFGDLFLQTKEGFVEWEFCKNHQKIEDKTKGELSYLLSTKKSLRKREVELVESVESCEYCVKHKYPPISEIILMLAQKGRAAGIHLIIATQSPNVNIITGSIKANFPTKVALRTSREVDSLVILDQKGAEKLLGKGDMLFSSVEGIERLQGFYI